jgi:pSer/pThr/pTyr-binding forkhead associated (FHA) protein
MAKDHPRAPDVETAVLSRPFQSPSVAAKLVVVSGADEGLEVALDSPVVIGSDPSCHMVLSDRGVSRRHAQVAFVDGNFVVKDLKSRNGTYLGGARVMEASVPLGAVLTLGSTGVVV